MRSLLYLGVVFLVGCSGTVLPRDRSFESTRVDNPCLTIAEQRQRQRDRLALPEQSKLLVPRDSSDFSGPFNYP